ncbi:MAG: GHKL domain-containing protein [Lachnospiraceae bacterium]|nr:GHKL domain-containing protein [Lachnospiraceae bacterium]
MEIWYELVSRIYAVSVDIVSAFCLYRLMRPFLKKKLHGLMAGGMYLAVVICCRFIPILMESFTAYLFALLAALLLLIKTEPENWEQKCFLTVTFFALRWLMFSMVTCIYQFLYFQSLKIPYFAESESLQFVLFTVNSVFYVLLLAAFLYVCVRLITRTYIYRREHISGKEALMLSIPSLAAMFGNRVIHYYEDLYTSASGRDIFDIYSRHTLILFAFYGFLAFSILTVIALFQNLKGRQEEERRQEFLQRELDNMQRHIRETEKLYQEIRSLKHDMGNHVMVLEALISGQEHEEAEDYLADLKQELLTQTRTIQTGNPVTDVILAEKKREAEEKGILFQNQFRYPQNVQINAFDISIILHNALANAIDAAADCEKKYIQIRSFQKKHMYMIEVCNSFCGEIRRDDEHALLRTTKVHGHGLGLSNIRTVARRYQGELEFEYGGGEFTLNVMLMGED